jgi:16S rRNA (guanine527-N7)-methyltransferase
VNEFFGPIDAYLTRQMIAISPTQRAALVTYLETLREWNEKLNLTAIKDPEQMVTKHVLDALTYLPLWANPPRRVIDVGTGAGIPGVVLAIMWPATHVTLAESITKKCTFLQHVTTLLALDNVHIVNERAEVIGHNWDYRGQYDLSTARAVAELRTLVEYLLPLCAVNGVVYAPKGPHPEDEVAAAAKAIKTLGGQLRDIVPIEAAPLEPRTMVRIDKIRQTLPQYPRYQGTPSKNPL